MGRKQTTTEQRWAINVKRCDKKDRTNGWCVGITITSNDRGAWHFSKAFGRSGDWHVLGFTRFLPEAAAGQGPTRKKENIGLIILSRGLRTFILVLAWSRRATVPYGSTSSSPVLIVTKVKPWLWIGIVTGSVNPPGFMPGSERVRVRVGIFYPGQNPYPVRGFGGYW